MQMSLGNAFHLDNSFFLQTYETKIFLEVCNKFVIASCLDNMQMSLGNAFHLNNISYGWLNN